MSAILKISFEKCAERMKIRWKVKGKYASDEEFICAMAVKKHVEKELRAFGKLGRWRGDEPQLVSNVKIYETTF